MSEPDKKPWWWPVKVGPELAARLRADYPEDAHLDDEAILEEYEYYGKFATNWDGTGDAQEQFDPLADAFLDLYAACELIENCVINHRNKLGLRPWVVLRAALKKARGEA